MTTRALLLSTLALLSGCWVSQSDFEAALCLLDEDGDGDPKCGPSGTPSDGDCDDSNPLMSTIRDETGEVDENGVVIGGAYDGFDNDCDGADLLDVDLDTYPGISRAEYEAIPGGDPWPAGLREEVDCADLPIDGQAAGFEEGVHPNAAEVFYDGVDGNCDGQDDFDQDGDGFASGFYADGYSGDLPVTDCDDNRADINPSQSEVANYDGDDDDCDGANDYDPDGDGRLTAGYDDAANVYKTKYGYDLTWIPDADCLDLDDSFGAAGPVVTQELAEISFARVAGDGACDGAVPEGASCEATWYDGLDDACDDIDEDGNVVRNDFDADEDGYLPTAERANFIAYVLRYAAFTDSREQQPYRQAMIDTYGDGNTVTEALAGAWFDAHDNDCNDNDPTVSPDGLEALGDSADQDCDGGNDTSRFAYDAFDFTEPGPVRAVATTDYVALVVNATGGVDLDDGAGVRKPGATVLSWANDEILRSNVTIADSAFTALRTTDDLHDQVAVVADGDNFYTAVSWASTRTRLVAALSEPAASIHFDTVDSVTPSSRTEVVAYSNNDLRCDDDDSSCWQVVCDGTSLHWHNFARTATMTERSSNFIPGVDAQDCFVLPGHLSGSDALVYAVDGGGTLTPYALSGGLLVESGVDPLAGVTAEFVRSHGEWLVVGQTTRVRLINTASNQITGLTGSGWVDADATAVTRDGSRWWAIAGVQSDGTLTLSYGPQTRLTTVDMPVQGPEGPLSVDSVAVAISGDRVLLAVTGSDTQARVGWTLFDIP